MKSSDPPDGNVGSEGGNAQDTDLDSLMFSGTGGNRRRVSFMTALTKSKGVHPFNIIIKKPSIAYCISSCECCRDLGHRRDHNAEELQHEVSSRSPGEQP